ncbi:MAG: hypothetical protein JRI96_07400 [Deltaproteobacteria bacterium]|nr:hypothetical protein [Deltaproteobacteria bacterium]
MRTFIQFTALWLTIWASYFLVKSTLTLTAKDISELSYIDYPGSDKHYKSMAQKKADTETGFILLLLSFILQSINLLWPMRWIDFATNRQGLIASLIAFPLFIPLSLYINKIRSKHIQRKISKIEAQEQSKK